MVGLYRISLFQIRAKPDLSGFRNSNPAGAGAGFGDNLFLNHGINTPDETSVVNNAVSCYKDAVQFSSSFVASMCDSF